MRVALRPLSAREELEAGRDWPALLPGLLALGLGLEDAAALAHNASLLFRAARLSPPASSPGELLDRLGIGQIAVLCERYAQEREALEELEVVTENRRRKRK